MRNNILTCFLLVAVFMASAETKDKEKELAKNATSTKSIGTVSSEEMEKFSALNPENALFGLIPGLTVLSNGGPVFSNSPTIKLRGVSTLNFSDPLVLIDGVQRPLSRLVISEIESVSVLKDAAALAPYGVRGANGVILIKTKSGEFGKMKVDVKYQHGIITPFRLPVMVDAPTYAAAWNEAITNDGLASTAKIYTPNEIELFRNGTNPDLYPNVNWMNEVSRDAGNSNQLDISFNGGSDKVRYFTNVNYTNDFGLINPFPSEEGYNTALNYYKLNLRTNLDVRLTETTRMRLNVMGSIDDYARPNIGISTIYQRAVSIPASAFPIKTTSKQWGGSLIYKAQNPVANIASSGYVRSQNRILFADLTLEQNLNAVLPGLMAEGGMSYDNMAEYLDTKAKTFQYETGGVIYGSNSELTFTTTLNDMYMNSTLWGKLKHEASFENSKLSSYLMYTQEDAQRKTRNNHVARQSFVGGVNFASSSRYFFDLAASYSGSSYLSANRKFGFYPAVSGAWLISAEDFMNEITDIDMLKLRASFGYAGNDAMSYELDRQYYMSGPSYYFTNTNATAVSLKEGKLPTTNLRAELAQITNLGIDLLALNGLNISVDGFYEKRSGILVSNSAVTSGVLGVVAADVNAGIVENKGIEVLLDYSGKLGDLSYGFNTQFSYAKNKIIERNEGFKPYNYLYTTGNSVGAYYGLQAMGFFKDQADIDNSPAQLFSAVKPGDIKYVDQNNDNKIDADDVVKLGYPVNIPEIYYSFKLNFEWKGIGLDMLFQGISNVQINRNIKDIHWPMYSNGNISEWYYNGGRWTPETAATATLPRLTTLENANNFRANSIWMNDGSYLKLRYADLYYQLPLMESSKLKEVKFFVRGTNLFSVDKIKNIDPEVTSVGYPTLTSYFAGCTVTF